MKWISLLAPELYTVKAVIFEQTDQHFLTQRKKKNHLSIQTREAQQDWGEAGLPLPGLTIYCIWFFGSFLFLCFLLTVAARV